MSNRRSKKSLKTRNHRTHKGAVKQGRTAGRKASVYSVKAQPTRGKATRGANLTAAKPARVSTKTKSGNGGISKRKKPIAVNPQLQELERGRRLRQLHEHGHSLAELARKFGCSKSLVRDLVLLASLPEELEQAYIQKEMGRKAVLKRVRAEKKQVVSKTPVLASEPQNDMRENFLSVLTKEERDKKITEHAGLIIDWVHSIDLAPCYWEGLFEQVKLGLYGPFRWLFSTEAPPMDEIKPDEASWELIKRFKTKSKNPGNMAEIINGHVTWLARWIQRVIPDRTMMEDAIDQARGHLLLEARKARWF